MREKSKLFETASEQQRGAQDGVLVRSGEVVPTSGIYEVIHVRAGSETDGMSVVALRGEAVQRCAHCGEQVEFRLLYAAPHVSEDGDFCNTGHNLN